MIANKLQYFLLLSFITAGMVGNEVLAQKLKAQPQGGIHVSATTTSVDSIRTQGAQGGYNVGMDLRLGGYNSWVYFQPGAHFYQARMNVYSLEELTDVANYQKEELQLSQVKIPLNLGFYLTGTDGILRVRASAGLTTSMVVDQTETSTLTKEATDFRTFGVGVNAGLGIDLAILTLDLRYEHGSTKIYRSANANMNFLSLTAGFIIPPSL